MEEPKVQLIPCSKQELNLDTVLVNGQSFRWKRYDSFLVGVALNRVWKCWRKDDATIGFQVLARFPRASEKTDEQDVNDFKEYVQLSVNLVDLYEEWRRSDSHFSSIFDAGQEHDQFEGIRILKQPLLETIFGFICSSNNNIARISKMVNELASLYGDETTVNVDLGDGLQDVVYHDFPSLNQMVLGLDDMQEILTKNKFGYRAKYVVGTVKKLNAIEIGFEDFEEKLKLMPHLDAKAEIQKFDGIGPKVADCICLMALAHHQVVPVDTHVFQITCQHYLPELKHHKSVNDTVYKAITSFYSERFGSHAGWAHSVLFSTRLKRFNNNSDEIQTAAPKKRVRKKK